jgi:photosystem II stability/assembly factor-like uncharacterized protein
MLKLMFYFKLDKMKRLLVFVPAIFLVLFLLNSFIVKENPTTKGAKSAPLNIVFRSADGGETWQNISAGLPESLQKGGVRYSGSFANDRGLYLRAGNGLYRSDPNATTSFWTKEIFPGKQRHIAAGRDGILAYDFKGQFLKKIHGTNAWSPMYTNFQEQAVRLVKTKDWMYENYKVKEVRSVFETAGGTVFVSSNDMLLRSANSGKTWNQAYVGDGRMVLVEGDGVLLSTSNEGILRSTDDGQTWDRVLNEGGVGMAVERIDGGFAALVNNTITQTNSLHISLDNGKTWDTIGEELQPSWINVMMAKASLVKYSTDIISIKQVGKYLVGSRPDAIFRSADMGKTWKKLALPAVKNFGFSVSVSGDVMYIIPFMGC